MKIKLDVRIILYGRPCRLPWPKCLVTGMLMHDLLAVAKKNLIYVILVILHIIFTGVRFQCISMR